VIFHFIWGGSKNYVIPAVPLSYYQEGTFTCQFVNTPLTQGTDSYTNNFGSYTRIGRCYYFNCAFVYTFSSNGRLSANTVEINMIGLPKPSYNSNCYTLGYIVGPWDNTINSMCVITQNANENVRIKRCNYIYPVNLAYQDLVGTVGNSISMNFSGFYFI
jgi:hypothetical protein